MSEQIKNGGPAFPVFGVNCVRVEMDGSTEWEPQQISDGMTLRDYFAAKAMQGYLAAPDCGLDMEEVAAFSYKMAGHMLAAREGGKEESQPSHTEISSDIKQANLNLLASKVDELLCMTDIQDEYPILAAELKGLAEAVKQ